MFISARSRRRRVPSPALVAAAAIVVLGIVGYLVLHNSNEDVHHGNQVEFQAAKPKKQEGILPG